MRPLFVALLVAAAPGFASNTADEADIAFELGNELYARRRYTEALREYFLSHRLVPNKNVLFNIARCYEQLERFDEAYRYYHDMQRMELNALDQQEVTRALARIRPRVALLEVVTEPSGAEVYVDREDLGSRGQSPQVLAVPSGKHPVFVKLEGYHPARVEVAVGRGRQTTQRITLMPILGYVELTGVPEGAEVREVAGGPVLGRVPGKVAVPAGRRMLHVAAPGFTAGQYPVEVGAEQTVAVKVALAPAIGPSGKLIVTANRPDARVRVDGKESGFTPIVLTVTAAEHVVEVLAPEMRPWRRTIEVPKDGELQLAAELRYAPPPVRAASKSLVALEEAPASTSVITADEIRAFGYTTLPEALEAVRGVFTADDRTYSYLGIRGFAPPGDLNTRVLILWDGHAMNDVWAGQGYAGRDLAVDLDEVDRIEIVRGPGSALYGTSALFAVINIVPRNRVGSSRRVEVTGEAGALGAWRGHATASVGDSGQSALLSASAYRSEGAGFTDLGEAGRVFGLDGENAYNVSARARWGGMTLFGAFNTRHKDIPTAPYNTVVGGAGTGTTDTRGFAELRYEGELPFGAVSARAYYDATRYRGQWAYGDGAGGLSLASDTGSADWIGTEARVRIGLFGQNHLTVGVEAQQHLRVAHAIYGYGNDGELPSINRTVLSGYVLDEWAIHPRLFVSLGLRLDKYLDLAALPITPRLAIIGRPYESGVTKLVAGQAFRAPNVFELFNEDFGVSLIPPDSLAPETITTVEFEHAHDVNEELRLTAGGYWNRIDDLVVLTERNDPSPLCGTSTEPAQCLQYANQSAALQAYGAEAELRWQAGRFALFDLGYSYVFLSGPTRQLTATPTHLLSARVLIPLADTGARIAARAKYQSGRAIEGALPAGEALLVDFGISGDAGNLRYFAGVKNLLDARYGLPFGPEYPTAQLPQLGRQFAVQLTVAY